MHHSTCSFVGGPLDGQQHQIVAYKITDIRSAYLGWAAQNDAGPVELIEGEMISDPRPRTWLSYRVAVYEPVPSRVAGGLRIYKHVRDETVNRCQYQGVRKHFCTADATHFCGDMPVCKSHASIHAGVAKTAMRRCERQMADVHPATLAGTRLD